MSGKEVLYVRSSKKKSDLSSGDDTSTNDDDVWDDTLLIEAYDKAVKVAQNEVMQRMQGSEVKDPSSNQKNKNKNTSWKVGDRCKCRFSEDNCFYEADITDIIEEAGLCIVTYVGYKNEEKVPLKHLLPSDGQLSRDRQESAALEDNNVNNVDMDCGRFSNNHIGNTPPKKTSVGKKKERFKTNRESSSVNLSNGFCNPSGLPAPPPSLANMVIPPPPPPHIFNHLNQDDHESEAMSAMLMSWYMSGYHTGYYQGLKNAKKHSS